MSAKNKRDINELGGDETESVEEEEIGGDDDGIPNTLMRFTNVLSELQNQRMSTIIENLSPAIKRRIKALKNLQLEGTKIEAKFFKEVHDLECKYHQLYVPLYEKRQKIVNGSYEPTEEESQWPSDDDEAEEAESGTDVADELKEKVKIEDKQMNDESKMVADVKGVPDFWLTIFKNVTLLSEMVQSHDEPILKHLIDIKTLCMADPMGFTIEFHFATNEYFTNEILTKKYEMKCYPDDDDPFSFEGPEIYKCIGCTINWNKGKNVTLKTVKKKQKHKSRGLVRTITKTVPNDSFFNFFAPPTIPDNAKGEDIDDELRSLLTSDFEIGHYIRDRVVPRAVLFFTGEEVDSEEEFDEDEDLEDDDEDEDDDGKENGRTGTGGRGGEDSNCKQQ